MHFEPSKDQRPHREQHSGDNPEIHGHSSHGILPEPRVGKHGVPVTIDNVKDRIALDDPLEQRLPVKKSDIPQDRCRPHADLQDDVDDLHQIPEKDRDRTGCVAQRQHQHEQAETKIRQLQQIQIGRVAVAHIQHQHERHEK